MDEIDRKILVALDKNVRASNTRIAKAARVSKDVVNYRIAKLQKEGILTGFYSIPAVAKLGINFYKLLLKFHSLNKEKEIELLSWLGREKTTAWVGSCDGNWNLIATLSIQNFSELSRVLKEVYSKYGKFISKKEVLIVESVSMLNEKYLYPNGEFVYEQRINLLETPESIDEKDKIILHLISGNARISTTEIAKKIFLTPEAAAKRLKNLFKRNFIIGLKPRISFTKLGYEYFHVFISAKTPAATKEIISFYKHHPDCVSILEHIGRYDMHLEFVVKTTQHFREVLKDLRDKFGDKIHEYEPLQIYTEYKINAMPA